MASDMTGSTIYDLWVSKSALQKEMWDKNISNSDLVKLWKPNLHMGRLGIAILLELPIRGMNQDTDPKDYTNLT